MVASSNFWFGSSGFYPYEIGQSCRFSEDNSEFLSRAVSSSGNRKTFTMSCWVKKTDNTGGKLFSSGTSATEITEFAIQGTDETLRFRDRTGGDNLRKETTATLRDMGAWYHLVCAVDVTQASNSNRVKIYINGTLQTAFDIDDTFVNRNTYVNNSGDNGLVVGKRAFDTSVYYDGYMAEYHFIDGTQVTADSFGETKEGVWIPKAYTGSYGTNGFYLKFNQTGTGTASASTIGADSSGNNNHLTSANLGSDDSNIPDSPTNNFCIVNPLSDVSDISIKIGSTNLTNTTDSWPTVRGTFGVTSGKWYYEVDTTDQSRWGAGWATGEFISGTTFATNIADSLLAYSEDPLKIYDFGTKRDINGDPSFDTSDILQVAIDIDAGKFWLGINNTFVNNSGGSAGNPAAGTNELETFTAGTQMYPSFLTNGGNLTVNFGGDSSFNANKTAQGNSDQNGHGDFFYTPPSGFLALCSANLPEPTISPLNGDQPEDNFNTVLWSGNGSTDHDISGVGFQPDWVWIKNRSSTSGWHAFHDAVRGAGATLFSNVTDTEYAYSDYFGPFQTDGYRLSDVSVGHSWNTSSNAYVGWNWLGANGTASNSDGDLDSTVSANTTAGFSIVSYNSGSSASSNQTVGHGLGVVPKMIIAKNREASGAWSVYHADVGNDKRLRLDTTAAEATSAVWGDTTPTSSVFTQRITTTNDRDIIAYCFAEVEGYSKFGSYTGNGNANGPFVYTGFRPAWVLTKRTDTAKDWIILDNKRDVDNVAQARLFANLSDAESTTQSPMDILSNGFKLRISDANYNASGGTWIYMAFAEMPFKYANAR